MTTDPIVVGWTVIALIGTVVALYGLWSARATELAAAAAGHNGARLRVARLSRWRERLRVLFHLMFFVAGLLAMLREPTPNTPQNGSRTAVIGFLVAGQAVVTLGSVVDQVGRQRLMVYLDGHLTPGNGTPSTQGDTP